MNSTGSHKHDAGLQLAEENTIPLPCSIIFLHVFFWWDSGVCRKTPNVFLLFSMCWLLVTQGCSDFHSSLSCCGVVMEGPSEDWPEGAVPPKSVRNESCSHDPAHVSRQRALPAHLANHKSQKQNSSRKNSGIMESQEHHVGLYLCYAG